MSEGKDDVWSNLGQETWSELEALRLWHPEIPGWSDDIMRFYSRIVAPKVDNGAVIVEIGTYKGRSLLYLAETLHSLGKSQCSLVGVDNWENPSIRHIFNDNLANFRQRSMIEHIGLPSAQAAHFYSTHSVLPIDVLFIDGNHDYEHVKSDIVSWRSLMRTRPGAIVAGHDYNPAVKEFEGLCQAVEECFADKTIRHEISCWWVEL